MKNIILGCRGYIGSAIDRLNSRLTDNIYRRTIKCREKWYGSQIVNLYRRLIYRLSISLKYRYFNVERPFKLHLGCGSRHIDGYINVDWIKSKATDVVCDVRHLGYPNCSVELIETYHVIEHLGRHDLPKALRDWLRVLIPGGKLVIECPDFDKAVKEYIDGNERRIDNIFGLQRFPGDSHLFGYNFRRLKGVLEAVGFQDVKKEEPTDYHVREEPCIRVVARKGKRG